MLYTHQHEKPLFHMLKKRQANSGNDALGVYGLETKTWEKAFSAN